MENELILEVPMAKKRCESHKENTMGYVERSLWAERKLKQGHIQRQCKDCGRWLFKCDV